MNIPKRFANAILLIAMLPAAMLLNIQQKEPEGYDLGQIKCIARDSTITDNRNKVIKLYGAASVTNNFLRVNADYIEVHIKDSTVLATGNVIAYDMNSKVIAKASSGKFHFK